MDLSSVIFLVGVGGLLVISVAAIAVLSLQRRASTRDSSGASGQTDSDAWAPHDDCRSESSPTKGDTAGPNPNLGIPR